jgi:hypothetical protein
MSTDAKFQRGDQKNLPSIFERPSFSLERLTKRVNETFITPRMNFENVFDEYIDTLNKFSHVRGGPNG